MGTIAIRSSTRHQLRNSSLFRFYFPRIAIFIARDQTDAHLVLRIWIICRRAHLSLSEASTLS